MAKNLDWAPILDDLVQIRVAKFFFKNLASSLDIIVSYHHVQYQKKLQSWENVVTDGQTDGQTDESYISVRCPTNVKRPIIKSKRQWKKLTRIR